MFNWIKKFLFGSKVVVVEEASSSPIQAQNDTPISTLEITPVPENPKRKDESVDVEQRPTKQVKREDEIIPAESPVTLVSPTKKPSTAASPVPALEKKLRS
jgi:hypothetical protein